MHRVGDFVASYVPSRAEFSRLDSRFRIPDGVFGAHHEYADYGFAVFQLEPQTEAPPPKKRWFRRTPHAVASDEHSVHPMAFVFPSRRPAALYFPTLHVHDGSAVPDEAEFDHLLYCQSDDPILTRTFGWQPSPTRSSPLDTSVDAARTKSLVAGKALAYRRQIVGQLPNTDHWYEAPACKLASLEIRDPKFACDLSAATAYYTTSDPKLRRWRETARTKLDVLSEGLRTGLAAKIAEDGDRWHLAEVAQIDRWPKAYLSNWEPHVFTTTSIVKLEPNTEAMTAIEIAGEGKHVETQNVRFLFSRVPSKDTILEIRATIGEILDRALA